MKEFNKIVQAQFALMQKTGKLFRVAMTGQQVWDEYISSFTKELNPIFRDPLSTSKNCNHCKNFIRRYGNIVAINDKYEVMSIFDVVGPDCPNEYYNTADVLSHTIKNTRITEVFFETFDELNSLPYESCKKSNTVFQLGIHQNIKQYNADEAAKYGVVKEGEIRTFHHIHLSVGKEFVDMSGKSVESIMGNYRDDKNVFQRAMETISLDTLKLVKDLINQGSLLNGATHLYKIEQIIPLKEGYDALFPNQRDNWLWVKSYGLPFAKFRNELIGVLCSELSEGEELNKACLSWNKRVDPANYMKATAPITQKQIDEANGFIVENGYEDSFTRRLATMDDIKASEILHVDAGDGKIKKVSVLDGVKPTTTRHKRNEFEGIEEMTIEKFMTTILPGCTSVEALVTNKMEGNFVTLTTADNPDSKLIFKWNNNYSWTFNGNLAGKSMIKDAVKSRGGNVEGIMRVTLAFPNTTDDYDLHLIEPGGREISFVYLRSKFPSSGMLDLDAQGKDGHQEPDKRVENIIYTDKNLMPKGHYSVYVNNWSGRGLHTPFTIEIEVEGEVTVLELKNKLSSNKVGVAIIKFDGHSFEVSNDISMNIIDSKTVSKEVYGVETNQFHKVNLVCLSPNHWGDNSVGNKHYFFMLEGAKTPASIRSFHNENLLSELADHRKVFEVLGTKTMIEPGGKQLSGIGFNATVTDEVILKLQGTHKRMIKVKF